MLFIYLFGQPQGGPTQKERLLTMGPYACWEKAISLQDIIHVAEELRQLAKSNIKDA